MPLSREVEGLFTGQHTFGLFAPHNSHLNLQDREYAASQWLLQKGANELPSLYNGYGDKGDGAKSQGPIVLCGFGLDIFLSCVRLERSD